MKTPTLHPHKFLTADETRRFRKRLIDSELSVRKWCEAEGIHYSIFVQAINGHRAMNEVYAAKVREFIGTRQKVT